MIDFLLNLDTELFKFFNGIHSSFFDTVMYWISHKFFWVPLYGFLVFLLFKHYGVKQGLILTLLVVVTFALSNTLSVEAFKNVFQRPRPSHNPDLVPFIHLVDGYKGGNWGFVSSHAANVFGLATVISLFLHQKIKSISVWIFVWATVVSYSRIYLGVHYPLDIIGGGLLGILIGLMVVSSYNRINKALVKLP